MKLEIGTNIRRMRREKDLTQEELAEVFGVSAQSVSRWESNTCYPDLELLPTMADFFGTTVDRLLGVDEALEQAQVNQYRARFQEAISRGDVDACIAVAREGAAAYPNNYTMLNQLMYILFVAGDEDGNIPNWQENMQEYDKEITTLGERIMKHCPDSDIRHEAMARLAFNHWEMGRHSEARRVASQLPSHNFCREGEIWRYAEGKDQLSAVQRWIRCGYVSISGGLYQLADDQLLPDEKLIAVLEKSLALDALLIEEPVPDSAYSQARRYYMMAAAYARLGKIPEALEKLELAADKAIRWDNRPKSGTYHSTALGEYHWSKEDFQTSDDRPCREILRDKWLENPDFDPLRQTPEYQALLSRLN